MINFRNTITDIREIAANTPSFLDDDIILADLYRVSKNELPAYALLKDEDPVILASKYFDELLDICGKDFVAVMDGDAKDMAFTLLIYATYSWCVKICAKLRRMERKGTLAKVDPLKVPEGATIH